MTTRGSNPLLLGDGPLLLDGGLATALEARGFDLDDPLWSARLLAEAPDAIRDVHLDYLRAGADVLVTSSYQATVTGFERAGHDRTSAATLLVRSSELALEARGRWLAESPAGRRAPLVAASIGPYGAFLADGSEYRGDYGIGRTGLRAFHEERWHLLDETGVDLFACETIPSANEVHALLELLRETPRRWAWVSVQCRDGRHLADGTPIREVARVCDGVENVAAIGVNCTRPEYVGSLLAEIAAASGKPRIAYPNAGERYDAGTRSWRGGEEVGEWLAVARSWFAAGAAAVGGCCRIGPERIARLRDAGRGPPLDATEPGSGG